jgi:hypothetical protein
VLVVIAGVTVDVSWVPRSVREPPDPIVGVSPCSPALDAAVDGRLVVAILRFGRRDRGRCVVGAKHEKCAVYLLDPVYIQFLYYIYCTSCMHNLICGL